MSPIENAPNQTLDECTKRVYTTKRTRSKELFKHKRLMMYFKRVGFIEIHKILGLEKIRLLRSCFKHHYICCFFSAVFCPSTVYSSTS